MARIVDYQDLENIAERKELVGKEVHYLNF